MTVPTLITDLSTTAASNSPAGSDAVFPDLDNFIRAYGAFIAQLYASSLLKAPIASPSLTGTLSLNATPSAWLGTVSPIEVPGGSVWSSTTGSIQFMQNAYLDSGSSYRWKTSNPATYYSQSAGAHNWYVSTGSPVAGNAIPSWSLAFTVDSTDGPQRSADASTNNGLVRKSQMDTADGLRCLKANNLSDVASASTALSNIGGVASTSFTGGNQSLAASGFQKLPGGLIIQWGYKTGNAAGFSVTFPTAFPTACVFVTGQCAFLGGGGFSALSLSSSPSTTGFSGYMNATSAIHVADDLYWLAIGY